MPEYIEAHDMMAKHRQEITSKIEGILRDNSSLRIVVVGTTCTGKSTLVKQLRGHGLHVHDMDELVFPRLTDSEREAVNKTPWTPAIGKMVESLAKKYVKVVPGEPVFGTIVFDSDLIVYLKIGDELLKERIVNRNVNLEDAKGMQEQIEQNISKSGIKSITIDIR